MHRSTADGREAQMPVLQFTQISYRHTRTSRPVANPVVVRGVVNWLWGLASLCKQQVLWCCMTQHS